MRRVLVVNALIFAVLAAASALAYVGFDYEPQEQREVDLMQDLAEEQVLSLETQITDTHNKLLRGVNFDELGEPNALHKLIAATAAPIVSLYVLDDELRLAPGGFFSTRSDKEGVAFRDWFMTSVIGLLNLEQQKVGVRGHKYFNLNGRVYLFSFAKRVIGDRTFYVVLEDDIGYIMVHLFPQYFNSPKRAYQVVDENGEIRFGEQGSFDELANSYVVEQPFVATLDKWRLRVAQRNVAGRQVAERKRLMNALRVGGAVVVIVGALAVLGFAIRRERRLNNLKSEFISNVSHELKTPLSIISMFGEMLANGRTKGPEQAQEYAEIIWRESVRLGRLIDNVLDFAKIERGVDGYDFADDANLAEVVERAIELSKRRVKAAEMTLETKIARDLPDVRLDSNAFTLAVLNLIDNAVKYAVKGKKITLTVEREAGGVALCVRDWGPGIELDEQERIFERFYRAKAVRLMPIRGSGIGLALVQHIARAHGGTVAVTSQPEQGSTFKIWLPAQGHSRADADSMVRTVS